MESGVVFQDQLLIRPSQFLLEAILLAWFSHWQYVEFIRDYAMTIPLPYLGQGKLLYIGINGRSTFFDLFSGINLQIKVYNLGIGIIIVWWFYGIRNQLYQTHISHILILILQDIYILLDTWKSNMIFAKGIGIDWFLKPYFKFSRNEGMSLLNCSYNWHFVYEHDMWCSFILWSCIL